MNSNKSGKDRHPAGDWLERTDFSGRSGERRRPSPREYRREGTLADWIGEERKAEVFANLRPETKSLESLLDDILEHFAEDDLKLLERLRCSWRELLGEDMAAQAHPVDLKDGTLFLEVNNSAWMYVFERQHKAKIRKILLQAGNGAIRDLQFVQRGRFSR
jgi:hypothetical protein